MTVDQNTVSAASDVVDPMEGVAPIAPIAQVAPQPEMVMPQSEIIIPQPEMDQATKNLNANFSQAARTKGNEKYGTSSQRDLAAIPQNRQAIV